VKLFRRSIALIPHFSNEGAGDGNEDGIAVGTDEGTTVGTSLG